MAAHKRKLPTIKEVARAAGVSTSTVSNVLNSRNNSMTAETLKRVQDAMADLNYRPSALARSLVTRETSMLGFILSEIEAPLFLQALPHADLAARGAEYNILLSVARSVEDEKSAVNLFLEKQADGIVFFSSSEHRKDDFLTELVELGVPTVLVNRPRQDVQLSKICWDQRGGVAKAVMYLVRLGHRRIAHMLGPESRGSTHEVFQGYRDGLAEAGLEFRDDYIVDGDFTKVSDSWRRSALKLLSVGNPPSAVIASDDVVASIAMRAFQSEGVRIPKDISVVGIDDLPFCPYLNPPLTTVRLPIRKAGRVAVEMVVDAISQREIEIKTVTMPCELIERGSCGPYEQTG